MTATQERATYDAAAFTRWCDTHLYTPAIRQGTRIVDRACDLHLTDLYRQLGLGALLATPRTARELANRLVFEPSSHIALEAMLQRLAERTGVVSVDAGPPARFHARAEPPDGAAELAALRGAMAELGPGFEVALEQVGKRCAGKVRRLRRRPNR